MKLVVALIFSVLAFTASHSLPRDYNPASHEGQKVRGEEGGKQRVDPGTICTTDDTGQFTCLGIGYCAATGDHCENFYHCIPTIDGNYKRENCTCQNGKIFSDDDPEKPCVAGSCDNVFITNWQPLVSGNVDFVCDPVEETTTQATTTTEITTQETTESTKETASTTQETTGTTTETPSTTQETTGTTTETQSTTQETTGTTTETPSTTQETTGTTTETPSTTQETTGTTTETQSTTQETTGTTTETPTTTQETTGTTTETQSTTQETTGTTTETKSTTQETTGTTTETQSTTQETTGTTEVSTTQETTPKTTGTTQMSTETTPELTTKYDCMGLGNYPDPNDCHSYYHCVSDPSGNLFVKHETCKKGYYFNPDDSMCERGSCSKPTTPPPFECQSLGSFPDPLDCHSYYKCTISSSGEFNKKHLTCPRGMYFDSKFASCAYGDC